MIFASMIIRSSKYLQAFPVGLLMKIQGLMKKVCATNPRDIRTYEIAEEIEWGTFRPNLIYLYDPLDEHLISGHEVPSLIIRTLKELSVQVLIHSLHNALGREIHVKILVKEGLLDYLVALKWLLPELSRDMLQRCLDDVSKFTAIKPPSLCCMARARLAKDFLGLEKVLDSTSLSDFLINIHCPSNK